MNHAWAYVAETGSPTRPYLKIRTWQNPMTSIDYTIRVLILGPAGVSPFQ
jgi:bacillopeptidase F (M6 metalloprotease family)